jgi:mannose/cellobiose epimerase-like protein (N-acyl-D-glucosamine 2-epimerase family)
VQAESFAAADMFYQVTNEEIYLTHYNRLWEYSWQHMIDHEYGAWFRILTRDNQKIDDLKSPAGKTDYHTLGACFDVLVSGADLRD